MLLNKDKRDKKNKQEEGTPFFSIFNLNQIKLASYGIKLWEAFI